MERINQFEFYELARKLDEMNEFPEGNLVDPHRAFWVAYAAQTHVEALLAGKPIELGVSRGKAAALLATINGLIHRHFTKWDDDGKADWKFPEPESPAMQWWEWGQVQNALANFELVFAEELREAATYRVPNRGIFNTRKLVDEAHCAFPADVEAHIPEKTKLEWRAAGRCLAFGMFTACGFHVARAVEGTLEAYFYAYKGKRDDKQRQWGEYLDGLEKVATIPAPDNKTMGELKQLKDDWRNPLMHPRVVLEESDARAVFNNGETLIMMMAQELAMLTGNPAQTALQLVQQEGAA